MYSPAPGGYNLTDFPHYADIMFITEKCNIYFIDIGKGGSKKEQVCFIVVLEQWRSSLINNFS